MHADGGTGMEAEEFLDRLDGVQRYGGGANARCPAHNDSRASLSVGTGEYGGVVFNCHAGCGPDLIISAMHLTWADVNPAPRIVAEYPYHDAAGTVLWTVERWHPKDFRCRPGLPPAGQRVLYARKWIDWARAHNQPVIVVEGEKDADALHELNMAATTSVGGAGKWLPQYSQELAGLSILVIADNDEPGKAHGRDVAAQLKGKAASVTLLKPRIGKDISEHLAAGLTLADLDPVESAGALVAYEGEDLITTPVAWAWTDHIAIGALTFIDGDPGDGKSVLTCDLAARWSSGMPMPDGSPNPFGERVGVVMVSAEDDPFMTIGPRLRAHGADMSRILCVVAGTRPDEPFSLAQHLVELEQAITERKARVLVLDPIMAFLGGVTDSNNDASVRQSLAPLAMMARRRGVAIVVVRHLNKGSGKAIYRGGGSIAFVGAARAAFLVSQHPDDEAARVLAVVKNNLGPKGPALVYRIVNDPAYNVARVQWEGHLATSAQELLDGPVTGEEPAAEVIQYLWDLVGPKPLSWKDITEHGKHAGYREGTLRAHRGKVLEKRFGEGGARDVVWAVRQDFRSPGHLQGRLQDGPHLQGHLQDPPANGNGALTSTDTSTAGPSAPSAPFAVEGGSAPIPEGVSLDDTPLTAEERQELELEKADNVCDVCGSFGLKHGKPYWVVRCRAHDPKTFGVAR